MTRDCDNLQKWMERRLSQKIELGDNNSYAIKGVGKASIEMESSENVHLSNILYVPSLKKNLVSISRLEDKGDRVAFVDGKVLVWPKGSTTDSTTVIGVREGRLYRLLKQPAQALVHNDINPSELWHKRYACLHYRVLPALNQMVSGVPELQMEHEEVYKGCALGKNVKKPFPSNESRSKEILDLVHSDVSGPIPVKSFISSWYYMTAIYIQNRSPRRILEDKTREEAFTRLKPRVRHLGIFGCPVYIHVPKDKRKKLEPSGKKGIFVGYSESSKAYRIYVLGQQQEEGSGPSNSLVRPVDHEDEPEGPSNPLDLIVTPEIRKRPAWLRSTLQEAKGHAIPRSTFKESKRPKRDSGYAALITNLIEFEPSTFEAASQQVWKDAMLEEYQSIMKNDVSKIVSRPEGKLVVTSKWVYTIKHAMDGSNDKYKARFVARGFSEKEGEDYDESFSPISKYTTIRSIVSIASSMGWNLHEIDVKTAFLNGVIEEEVYREQPQGSEVHGRESHVC
eukprot:PITA_05063